MFCFHSKKKEKQNKQVILLKYYQFSSFLLGFPFWTVEYFLFRKKESTDIQLTCKYFDVYT